jgi:hypothetical protein
LRRRIHAPTEFYESIEALGSSTGTVRAVAVLLQEAMNASESAPPIAGLRLRVARAPRSAHLAPLRLFYWMDDGDTYLLHVEWDLADETPQ